MAKKIISLMTTITTALPLLVVPAYSVSATTGTMKLGDYVYMGTYDTDGDGTAEPILWRCVAFEKIMDTDMDGSPIIDSTDTVREYQEGYLPLMLADTSICKKVFDAQGGNTAFSHGRNRMRTYYGSNYWGDSNIRDWLNSEDAKVNYTCNNKPAYSKEAGFLTNFTDKEKTAINTVCQKSILNQCDYDAVDVNKRIGCETHINVFDIDDVVQNYSAAYSEQTTDTVFLLDVRQIYNVYSNEYLLGNTDYFCLSSCDCWLRSPCSDDSYSVRYVTAYGEIDSKIAGYDSACGVRPGFFLDMSQSDFEYGTGTQVDPYAFEDYITFGGADNDKSIDAVYGTAKEENLSEYVTISSGSAAGAFTYSFDYEVPESISINGDTLLIGEKTKAGRYEIDVNVSRKGSDTSAFTITLTVTVMPEFTGNGTQDSPYVISNLETLEAFRDSVNNGISYSDKFIRLAADIDMAGKYGKNAPDGEESWAPIGASQRVPFEGSFDGGGHKITGLYINNTDSYQGLFGLIKGGKVSNLSISGTVASGGYAGGLCGASLAGTITNCRVECSVSGGNAAGGLCGAAMGGNITNSVCIGTVVGSRAGGICGYNEDGELTNCYFLKTKDINSTLDPIGMNEGGKTESCEGKNDASFLSGEVAYLLQSGQNEQLWGQTVGNDYPQLTSENKVYKVTFSVIDSEGEYSEYAVRYANCGGKTELPASSDIPEFKMWFTSAGAGGEEFTAQTLITGDIIVYAKLNNEETVTGMVTYPIDHGAIVFDSKTGIITGAEGVFLTILEIPEEINGVKIREIGDGAFRKCDYIKSVTLPDTIVRIGEEAFKYTTIQNINIPSSVHVIEKEAFSQSYLREIAFEPGITIIGDSAFSGSCLKSVELPNTVESVGNDAFGGMSNLQTAVLYGNIGDNAFSDDSALTTVEINGNCASVGENAFSFCSALKSVKLCETVSVIGKRAFYNCLRLYDINLPENISDIGEEAFSQTPIEQGGVSTTGSFNIYGSGIAGTDYTYSETDNTLTILSSAAMLLENAGNDEVILSNADAVSDTRIVIAENVDAVLRFYGVDIDVSGETASALSLENGSALDLTLMGDNTLVGGDDSVGIDVSENAELIVNGDGNLTLSGGSGAADINGSAVINSGKITAHGDVLGFEGNVTLNGGIITFSDKYMYLNDDFNGIVYVGEVGEVHGDVVISQDTILPEDTNLYIPADEASLTIANGASITIPSTSNLTITYGGKEITVTPADGEGCVMGRYGENGLDICGGMIVIEGKDDIWLTCITVPDKGGVILFYEDGSIEVPAETYVEINLDDGITAGEYGGIIKMDGTVTDNVSVLLNSQGGSFVFIPPVPMGDKITKPDNPTRSGYTFAGWYKEADCTTAWDFENDTADENITLYAKWKKKSSGGGGGSSSSKAKATPTPMPTEAPKTKPTPSPDVTDMPQTATEPTQSTVVFDDTQGHWAKDYIEKLAAEGIVNGTTEKTFEPDGIVTRAQFAQMLMKTGLVESGDVEVHEFNDVSADAWYYEAVNWAVSCGIAQGMGDGTFAPDAVIAREQMAAMTNRFIALADIASDTDTEVSFADEGDISAWARADVLALAKMGIIKGRDNGKFDAQANMTRAESAVVICNLLFHKREG